MKNMIRIMLIEDNEEYREGVVCVLANKPRMEVVSQYGTAEIALRDLKKTAVENLPDIILLDLNLVGGMSGLEALPLIRQQAPDVRIIILTQSNKEADVLKAIRLGAAGYLLKSATSQVLIEGIELVYSGGATLDLSLAKFILNTISQGQPELTMGVTLSKREMDVLTLIAKGDQQKQIADRLGISRPTVNEYIKRIYIKLEVQNAPAAVAEAYRSGILPPGE